MTEAWQKIHKGNWVIYGYSVILCFLLQLTKLPPPVHCHSFYFLCLYVCYHKSISIWTENTRWAYDFGYITLLSSSLPLNFLFAECWLEVLVKHRMVAESVPGQLPLFIAKAKLTRRTSVLVITLDKLIHCCTTPLVNKSFVKSKLNLPSYILGLLPLIIPSASIRNLVLSSLQCLFKLLWTDVRSPFSCCFSRLNKSRFVSLFLKVTYFWPMTVMPVLS